MKIMNYLCGFIILALFVFKTSLFADGYRMTTTIDQDRAEVAIRPVIASLVADKWYERGDKDIALEFDKIDVQNYPSSAGSIADKWYERGEKTIALEFDKIRVQNYPSSSIGDKWYERGEKSIALEFDKILVQHYPASREDEIADKWYERGDKDILFEFDKLYPSSALKTVDKLIQSGQFPEAVEYGNALLAYWVSQSDEDVQKNIDSKLGLALRVKAFDYYEILKSKVVDIVKDDINHNYLKSLENLLLKLKHKNVSMI